MTNSVYEFPASFPVGDRILQSSSGGVLTWISAVAGGTVTASPQLQIPFYSAVGTDDVITGAAALTITAPATGAKTLSLISTAAGDSTRFQFKNGANAWYSHGVVTTMDGQFSDLRMHRIIPSENELIAGLGGREMDYKWASDGTTIFATEAVGDKVSYWQPGVDAQSLALSQSIFSGIKNLINNITFESLAGPLY